MADASSANSDETSFLFGLNDNDFSDRVLSLQIIPDDDYNAIGFKITTLLINSIILAAKSPFFFKLFKNGMRESQNKTTVSLTIKESEEASLIELVNFMYGSTPISTSAQNLVNLLIIADKFEVRSCMRFCVDRLVKLPMSPESALLFLDLHLSILVNDILKPLIDAAKQYVANRYSNFTKCREELMKQPLCVIEAVLGSEGVLADSEDDVYEFILEWSREFYPDQEERREMISKHLVPLIGFPNMSCKKLKEVLVCPEFEYEHVSKLVMEALFSKVELPWLQPVINVSNDLGRTPQETGRSGRMYSPHCVVSFNIKKDKLQSLSASKEITSKSFRVGENRFHLSAKRYVGGEGENSLALYLHMKEDTKTCTLVYEFEAMNKSSNEFQNNLKSQDEPFDGKTGYGSHNLLGITWTELMSDTNDYFINDMLYLRVLVKAKTSNP